MTELFKNSHEALVFAFRYSSQQYALSPMSKMMKSGGGGGSGKGLVALDGAGQAGLIRAKVDALPAGHRACVIARFSPKFEECHCCGSRDKVLQEYKEAIATLGHWALSSFSGLSARVAREYVIRSYYEKGLSMKAAADASPISKSTLYDYRAKILGKLADLDNEAQALIDEALASSLQD